jgi:hypothetical protein
LEFFNEETEFLQDQLDHYAKADPNGLEALRNGIEAALIKNSFTRDTRQMGITGDNLMDFLYNQYQSVLVTPRPTLARSDQIMTKMRRGLKKARGRNMNTHNIFRLDKRNMNTHNIFRLDK